MERRQQESTATKPENASLSSMKPPQWSLVRSFSEANVRDLSSYMNRMNEANYYYGQDTDESDDEDDDDDDDEDDEDDDEDNEEENDPAGKTSGKTAVPKQLSDHGRNAAGQKGSSAAAGKNKRDEQALDVPPLVEEFLRKLFVASGFETPQWLVDILCYFHENLETDSKRQVDQELALLITELDNTSMNTTPHEYINACGAAFQLLGNVVNTVAQAELDAPVNATGDETDEQTGRIGERASGGTKQTTTENSNGVEGKAGAITA